MEHGFILLLLAAGLGLFMAWGIGANDVANAMGPSVGSKALTLQQALLIAAVFEFGGAVLAGGNVTATVHKGIVDPALFAGTPDLLVYGMLASLLAAGAWLAIASRMGWPVSTTHSIVGAIVGFAAIAVDLSAVEWSVVGSIAAGWVVSPLVAGLIAAGLFVSVRRLVLGASDALVAARRYVPFYIFLAGFIISSVTLLSGLRPTGVELTFTTSLFCAFGFALVAMVIGAFFVHRVHAEIRDASTPHAQQVERIFGVLMIFTACTMAFAHGSNDVANAVGPVAAVISVLETDRVSMRATVSIWILMIGGAGILAGLFTYGYRVMATVGERITELTPSRGFAATLAAASTVAVASGTGLPISTTHTLIGALIGVGLARGAGNINFSVVGSVVLAWLVTLPAGALLSVIFFSAIRAIFSGSGLG